MAKILPYIVFTVGMMIHAEAQNLLTNGNFESGNSGFTTDYTHSPTNVTAANSYAVIANPRSAHGSFADMSDHTSGSGLMLVVNGSTTEPVPVVWSQEVNVFRNQTYTFSAWAANLFGSSTSIISIRINGEVLTPEVLVPDEVGRWNEITRTWNSRSATTALIEIVFVSQNFIGNDTALDDFSFSSDSHSSCIDPSQIPTDAAYEELQVLATVPGNSNPFLAGQPDGVSTKSDLSPAQSPVLASTVTPGDVLYFSTEGSVSFAGATNPNTPEDGGGDFRSDSALGIAGYLLPIDTLVGVFLSDAVPADPAPDELDYGTDGLSFEILAPQLRQIFYIGDGLTGSGTGTRQGFVVPSGATRLYLGTTDGFGWYNNTGEFEVNICRLERLPYGTELGPTLIKFDRTAYTANVGDMVLGTLEIDPIPPGGLYSQGLVVTVRNTAGTLAGAITTGSLPMLDFDGLVLGGSAAVPNDTGSGGIKGSALFSITRETSVDPILGSFSLSGLPRGDYNLAIAPWNDLGPTEDIFVTGECLTLDPYITFGTATIEVLGTDPVFPELTLSGEIAVQLQTGLLEQRLNYTNNGDVPIEGFRLFITGLPADVILKNAHGVIDGIPYIDILTPLAAGESIEILLEYERSSRDPDFTPEFTLGEPAGNQQAAGNSPPLPLDLRVVRKTGEGMLLEFLSVKNQRYLVEYSDNLSDWKVSLPPITGTGQRLQWFDQGPPRTRNFPSGARFYRIVAFTENP